MAGGQQSSLSFPDAENEPQRIVLEDADLLLYRGALSVEHADTLLDYCLTQLSWRQDHLMIAGRRIPLPRLQNWYGDSGADYAYSGLALEPLPWPEKLLEVRERIEQLTGHSSFNSALANLYRTGADSVGWHSDNEKTLGDNPVIASISLGVTRVFEMKHAVDRAQKKLRIPLSHGSLLLMAGTTQRYWRHQLPKDPSITAPRVNLTFRTVTLSAKLSH